MRPHSSLVLFSADSSRRARPYCALSLTTASAQGHNDPEAMDVDPVTLSEDLSAWKVLDRVPFPSHAPRKHALLRSSAPLVTGILTSRKNRDSSNPASPTAENQPPRKRTRTSALLQPPIKLSRAQSLSTRHSPSRLPRSASSLLSSGHTRPSNPPKRAEEPFTYAFPTSSMPTISIMSQSPLLDLISCLITPASLDRPSPQSSVLLPRRRKPLSGGTALLRNVYKSVVRGLALKYSVTDISLPAQVYQVSSGNTPRSPFDIQDALLADSLRYHLTLQGEDTNVIVFEIEKMDSHQTESPLHSDMPPGNASLSNPILSYERLVSFILLQKRSEGRSRTSRKGLACRKPSRLAESGIDH